MNISTTYDFHGEYSKFCKDLVDGTPANESYDRVTAVLAHSLGELQILRGGLTQKRIELHRLQTAKLVTIMNAKVGDKELAFNKAEILSKDTDEQRAVDAVDGDLAVVTGMIEGATSESMAIASIRRASGVERSMS